MVSTWDIGHVLQCLRPPETDHGSPMRTPFLIVWAAVRRAAAGDARPTAGAPLPTAIEVSTTGCGTGWTHPHTGGQVLSLRNDGATAAGVTLIDPASGAVY